jgi:hypothetical protein
MAALTPEALWIQDTWQLRAVPLQNLGVERRQYGKELALTVGLAPSAEKLTLIFASPAEGEQWAGQVQIRQLLCLPEMRADDDRRPEGVALVRRAPDVPHQVLGRVEFTAPTRWAADRGLQLRAGMRGADAVIGLERRLSPELGWGARQASGLAIRVEDAESRDRLRRKWYAEEVGALVNLVLLLLLGHAGFLTLMVLLAAGSGWPPPAGWTLSQALGLGLGVLYAWPLVLLALLRVLRWPQLLRSAGLAVMVTTAGLGATLWLAQWLAMRTAGASFARASPWFPADAVTGAFAIAGVVLGRRAWRLAVDARGKGLSNPLGLAVSPRIARPACRA